jgi:hypothetical protein
MAERVVAIHQPNFLPWLGYFDKLARADVFVLLDHVQFPKKGGTWVNRVRMLTGGGGDGWVTVPVDRSYHGVRAINEMRTDETRPWREKLLKTIAASYGRSPGYDAVHPLVKSLIEGAGPELAALNERGVRELAGALGIEGTEIVRSSDLAAEGQATELLISIARELDAGVYLCGAGSEGYLEPERFAAAGIELRMQEFSHPVYEQESDEFIPGLSAVDALMSLGPEKAGELLR